MSAKPSHGCNGQFVREEVDEDVWVSLEPWGVVYVDKGLTAALDADSWLLFVGPHYIEQSNVPRAEREFIKRFGRKAVTVGLTGRR